MILGQLEKAVVDVKAVAAFLGGLARGVEIVLAGDEAVDGHSHVRAGEIMCAKETNWFAVNDVAERVGATDLEI